MASRGCRIFAVRGRATQQLPWLRQSAPQFPDGEEQGRQIVSNYNLRSVRQTVSNPLASITVGAFKIIDKYHLWFVSNEKNVIIITLR